MEVVPLGVQYSIVGLCIALIAFAFGIVKMFTDAVKAEAIAFSNLVTAIEKSAASNLSAVEKYSASTLAAIEKLSIMMEHQRRQ